jgi:hypothetical protein
VNLSFEGQPLVSKGKLDRLAADLAEEWNKIDQ